MRALLSTAAAAALFAFVATPASAAFMIDFTDSGWGTLNGTSNTTTRDYGFLGGLTVEVSSSPDGLNDTQDFDGFDGDAGDAAYCQAGGGQLACATDGFGVGASDDEITFTSDGSVEESITVSFFEQGTTTARALSIVGLDFLDAFKDESVLVSVNGGTASEYDAVQNLEDGEGGYLNVAELFSNVTTITFRAGDLNDDAGLEDVALAGMQVVPLPAAAWLMIGGLGAVYAAARRRRAANAAAA